MACLDPKCLRMKVCKKPLKRVSSINGAKITIERIASTKLRGLPNVDFKNFTAIWSGNFVTPNILERITSKTWEMKRTSGNEITQA